jgi:N-sulfoglucosamine sulfohydrolase
MPDEELYELKADPWEIRNLAASKRPADQAALRKLRAVLEQWIVDTEDQGRFPEARTTAGPANDAAPQEGR